MRPSPRPRRRLHTACWAIVLAFGWLTAAGAEELHGADALFRGGGLTIAWAVARDRDDAKTAVLLAITDPAKRYDGVDVVGLDPFSHKREIVMPHAPLDGSTEIRLPRKRFSDLPRTELRFYKSGAVTTTVYYLGVPDTTPEFPDADAARRYLTQAVR